MGIARKLIQIPMRWYYAQSRFHVLHMSAKSYVSFYDALFNRRHDKNMVDTGATISQHHGCYMRMETPKLVNMFIIMSGTCQSYTTQVLVKCLLNICILSHIYATYQPHVYHILATCMPHISHIYATSPPYVCHILDKPQPHVFHNSIIV